MPNFNLEEYLLHIYISLFDCPILTQEFVSNLDCGTQENLGNVLCFENLNEVGRLLDNS